MSDFHPTKSIHPPVIRARDIHKSYRRGSTETPVLSGANLTVQRGECVYLVGPSGSGKSTLLSILGCILTPDQGRVEILGHDLARLSNRRRTILRRDRLGFVFQRFQLIRGLSAFDNIAVPLALRGVPPRRANQKTNELLGIVGLTDRAGYRPDYLSAGQCQRVAIARALVSDPDVVLADEPTAALDAQSGIETMKLLQHLIKGQNKTAVVVTHDHRIFQFADRILRIEDGAVLSCDMTSTTH